MCYVVQLVYVLTSVGFPPDILHQGFRQSIVLGRMAKPEKLVVCQSFVPSKLQYIVIPLTTV